MIHFEALPMVASKVVLRMAIQFEYFFSWWKGKMVNVMLDIWQFLFGMSLDVQHLKSAFYKWLSILNWSNEIIVTDIVNHILLTHFTLITLLVWRKYQFTSWVISILINVHEIWYLWTIHRVWLLNQSDR